MQKTTPSGSSWREWLSEHGPKLLLFTRQQTRSQQDAEDILQDALVKLVDKIETNQFSGGQEAWMPYLYTALRRLAIDLGREDIVVGDSIVHSQDEFHPWFEGNGSDDETCKLLEGGLKELPKKFAEVIVMKIWGERTFAEIGDALEISPNTAASRYRYGLEALKKKLSASRKKGDLSI